MPSLYEDAKYAEALVEFVRAYEIAPHPLVLYNIAGPWPAAWGCAIDRCRA